MLYELFCDFGVMLIGVIGLKKVFKGMMRGVFVVDKVGKVFVV